MLGDFNGNLTHCNLDRDVSNVLELMYSNTSKSATLIDNKFVNEYDPKFVSGNLAISLSDHLAQL